MSLKKVGQVKADKGFKIPDIIVYGVILAVVVILMIVVLSSRDTSPLRGVQIIIDNDVVFEYDFEKGEYDVVKPDFVEIIEDGDDDMLLVIHTDGGGYNNVTLKKNGSVTVTSANCNGKDCVYMPEIKDNSGWIYCWTHRLQILPYDFNADDGNIVV